MTSFHPSDPDFERRVRASFDAQPAMRLLGVTMDSVEAGSIELGFDHDDRLTQQHGFIHAGFLTAVLDSACGYAAFSLMPADAAVLTVEFKVNLLRPARADRYLVSGEVVKAGRTLTVSRGVTRSSDSAEPIAMMTATLMALVGASIEH